MRQKKVSQYTDLFVCFRGQKWWWWWWAMSHEVSTDLSTKYQKLATEYAKLRAQVVVLKKGVLDEQEKNNALTEQVRLPADTWSILKVPIQPGQSWARVKFLSTHQASPLHVLSTRHVSPRCFLDIFPPSLRRFASRVILFQTRHGKKFLRHTFQLLKLF